MVTRPAYQPPIYGRFTSSAQLGAIIVFVSDPILEMHPEARIGWFLQAEYLADDLVRVVHDLIVEHRLDGIVWNGWSAGGYAAVRFASRTCDLAPTMAFSYAPQNSPEHLTWWANYYASLSSSAQFDPYCELAAATGSPRKLPRDLSSLLHEESDYYNRFAVSIRVNNRDMTHLAHHLRPIIKSAPQARNLDWAVLNNGLGHGEESNDTFWKEFRDATDKWTSGNYSPALARSAV